jgi:hypothetical protein
VLRLLKVPGQLHEPEKKARKEATRQGGTDARKEGVRASITEAVGALQLLPECGQLGKTGTRVLKKEHALIHGRWGRVGLASHLPTEPGQLETETKPRKKTKYTELIETDSRTKKETTQASIAKGDGVLQLLTEPGHQDKTEKKSRKETKVAELLHTDSRVMSTAFKTMAWAQSTDDVLQSTK